MQIDHIEIFILKYKGMIFNINTVDQTPLSIKILN